MNVLCPNCGPVERSDHGLCTECGKATFEVRELEHKSIQAAPRGLTNSPEHREASWLGVALVSTLVWGLFVAACVAPAIYFDDGRPAGWALRLGTQSGWHALLFGWQFPFCIPWSANFLLVAGWMFLHVGRFKTAARLGGVGALLALTTWGFDFPHLLVGYYLWQASLVALTTGAAVQAHVWPTTPDKVSVIERRLSPPGGQSPIVS